MNQFGVYAGGALLSIVLGVMLWMWWQGRKAGVAITDKTEALHAKEANQVRDTVRALSDADLDSELYPKR